MNTTKTVVLMCGLTVLLVLIGGAFGGRQGMIMAFMFANYKLHSKQQTRIDNLQSKLRKPVPADVERDVDALRHALLQFPLSPIGNHINAEIVAQGLGWDLQRLTAVALKGHWGLRHSRCEGVFR